MSSRFEEVKQIIHRKYNWLSDEDMERCYNTAIKDYLLRKYPSSNNRPTVEQIQNDFIVAQWISDRMEDILSRAGGNIIDYKENGVSFTYASSYIDENLLKQILPQVGIPK